MPKPDLLFNGVMTCMYIMHNAQHPMFPQRCGYTIIIERTEDFFSSIEQVKVELADHYKRVHHEELDI